MASEKIRIHRAGAGAEKKPAAKAGRSRLKRVARSTLLAAGLTVAQWSVESDAIEPKLFSPSLIDRLQSPLTRFHD